MYIIDSQTNTVRVFPQIETERVRRAIAIIPVLRPERPDEQYPCS